MTFVAPSILPEPIQDTARALADEALTALIAKRFEAAMTCITYTVACSSRSDTWGVAFDANQNVLGFAVTRGPHLPAHVGKTRHEDVYGSLAWQSLLPGNGGHKITISREVPS